MNFALRLKNLRKERQMTQQQLADATKVSVITIRNWERGDKSPSMNAIISLCNTFGVSADLLLGNVRNPNYNGIILSPQEKRLIDAYNSLDDYGKKLVDAVCELEKERILSVKARTETNITPVQFAARERFIPCYTTPSAAGYNVPLDGEDFEMILVDEHMPADADYAVNIQGNSMMPYISDGDMVYVKKTEELVNGDIGIFCVDGAMYCKQLYVDKVGNLTLVSTNPDLRHTNVYLPADGGSELRVCGKVLIGKRIELPRYLFEKMMR